MVGTGLAEVAKAMGVVETARADTSACLLAGMAAAALTAAAGTAVAEEARALVMEGKATAAVVREMAGSEARPPAEQVVAA